MRAATAASLLVFSLLGACASQPQYLLSESSDSPQFNKRPTLNGVPARYTAHGAGPQYLYSESSVSPAPAIPSALKDVHANAAATAQVLTLRIDDTFTAIERGKIESAVNEWNYALNGAARFDFVSQPAGEGSASPTWLIRADRNNVSTPNYYHRKGQRLAVTAKFAWGGGLMMFYTNRTDRAGRYDLHGIALYELGFVLGVDDPEIMVYTAAVQNCISKDVAEAVAVARNLPLSQLNWCETNTATAAR